MFTIKNKPKSPKMIWDAKTGQPLLTFKNGCFETEDSTIAEKAKSLGYEVIGEESKQPEDGEKKKSGRGKQKDSGENTEQPEDGETGKTVE